MSLTSVVLCFLLVYGVSAVPGIPGSGRLDLIDPGHEVVPKGAVVPLKYRCGGRATGPGPLPPRGSEKVRAFSCSNR